MDAEVLFSAARTSELRYCFDLFRILRPLNQNHSGSAAPGSDVLPVLFLKPFSSSPFVLRFFFFVLSS